MDKFVDIIFGANIMCMIFNIGTIVKGEATDLTYVALGFLCTYFLLEIPRRIFN